MFTEVITNVGDGYDNCTGSFTAPVSGAYMFTAQVCTKILQFANVNIVANGTTVEASSQGGATANEECFTLTGVSVLEVGEQASIQGSYKARTDVLFENEYNWITFSGILVNPV